MIVLALLVALLIPAHPGHTEICYWKDRHKAHCAEGFYLSKKKPGSIEILIGKGNPCDPKGCVNLAPPRELGWY